MRKPELMIVALKARCFKFYTNPEKQLCNLILTFINVFYIASDELTPVYPLLSMHIAVA